MGGVSRRVMGEGLRQRRQSGARWLVWVLRCLACSPRARPVATRGWDLVADGFVVGHPNCCFSSLRRSLKLTSTEPGCGWQPSTPMPPTSPSIVCSRPRRHARTDGATRRPSSSSNRRSSWGGWLRLERGRPRLGRLVFRRCGPAGHPHAERRRFGSLMAFSDRLEVEEPSQDQPEGSPRSATKRSRREPASDQPNQASSASAGPTRGPRPSTALWSAGGAPGGGRRRSAQCRPATGSLNVNGSIASRDDDAGVAWLLGSRAPRGSRSV